MLDRGDNDDIQGRGRQKPIRDSLLDRNCVAVFGVLTLCKYNTVQCDEANNHANRRKHGLEFADVPLVFAGQTMTLEDLRHSRGEQRYLTVGTLAGRTVIIAHTLRGDATWIISMRKANARERARYQERLGENR